MHPPSSHSELQCMLCLPAMHVVPDLKARICQSLWGCSLLEHAGAHLNTHTLSGHEIQVPLSHAMAQLALMMDYVRRLSPGLSPWIRKVLG